MSAFDRFAELAKGIFNVNLEIRHLRETQEKDQRTARELAKIVSDQGREIQAVRERVVQLETQRTSDVSEMRTDLERFKLEVERAMLRAERQKQISGSGDGEAGS